MLRIHTVHQVAVHKPNPKVCWDDISRHIIDFEIGSQLLTADITRVPPSVFIVKLASHGTRAKIHAAITKQSRPIWQLIAIERIQTSFISYQSTAIIREDNHFRSPQERANLVIQHSCRVVTSKVSKYMK